MENTIKYIEKKEDVVKKNIGILERELASLKNKTDASKSKSERLNKETYTPREVIELLNDFGEHVAEQCTGRKLSVIGELYKWNNTK